ncbi:M16 family metallopeptidase [Pseudoblastomonas halimionae]|uniref:Insulinase family protein n=1 Tax=Alteriqipengyuania halimionae TaxID=1926630 RepID=A0A6I4U6X9_9SPHN|nr:pitrilysin family protein [Alteriqipengyuania halimionae]MXP10202.1 insulinase family protein [Alteriqipengyuania halimionae]
MKNMASILAIAAFAVSGCATTGDTAMTAAPTTAPAATSQSSDLAELVDEVRIPYDVFTLPNGLTTVVHTDRKAPLVAVSVWYDVGSKHEPKGKTGFAHLFEHLMFNGSENADGDFFEPLQQVGATGFNGTTNADRTNYFETVPTAAIDRVLMLESDRMGYLLGAVTQEKLDNQRGVVQNEKRRGDNQPYGLLRYEVNENIFPRGHPYFHSTIGSMDDLNAASLEDVKNWFKDHYGPNNAVLVLAGDIDVATAKEKVAKWFGAIPRGDDVVDPEITVPQLAADKEKIIKDQVSTTRIFRMWPIPGETSADSTLLSLAQTTLGGLASSRLDNALVRGKGLAVSVSSWAWTNEDAGVFIVQADLKPGVERATLEAALDEEVAKFIAEGPSADELARSKTSIVSGALGGLESVGGFGGKAVTLAEGELYHDDPGHYRKQLEQLVAATPASVRSVVQKWLAKPRFALVVEPGERTEGGENRGGAFTDTTGMGLNAAPLEYYCNPEYCNPEELGTTSYQDRSQLPAVGQLTDLDFPDIERATLSNGMQVYFARRDAVPKVSVRVVFDAGYTADSRDAMGVQSLMLQTMDEGTKTLDATQFAIAQERLGASINGFANLDDTSFQLSALSTRLAPSLDLLADFIRNPGFRADDLGRVRAQQLNRIAAEKKSPGAAGYRALSQIVYGDHPYGIPGSGLGDATAVEVATPATLEAAHDAWIRPDNAQVFVVGDTTLAEAVRLLEASFGDWKAPATPAPTKNFDAPIPAPDARIVLINRPNSPQSVILGARVLDNRGSDDNTTLYAANEVLGGSFLSRINMNLRETKGWSYGSRSSVSSSKDRLAYIIQAEVQADRTGDSILELEKEVTNFVGDYGVTADELERTVNGNVRELPGQFETSGAVLGGIVNIVKYDRPDNYYETIADKYRALSAEAIADVAARNFVYDDIVYVVVGDAEVVLPQLEKTGLPVEVREMEQ